MRAITVLYDGACPFCERCRDWLASTPQRIPLDLVDCRAPEAHRRFGRVPGLGRELVAIDDEGRFWVGPAAFVMCLWALRGWCVLAGWLLAAPVRPLAIAAFRWISDHRGSIGSLFGAPCSGAHCGVAHGAAGPYR